MPDTDDPAPADHLAPDPDDGAPPGVPAELLQFTLQNCELLAFKLRALRAFSATEYQYWVRKLIEDGVIAENEFGTYKSLLSRCLQVFDTGPRGKAPRKTKASASASAPSKPKRSKAPARWSDPRVKKVYRRLAYHVHTTAPTLPEPILQNLELLVPDAIYHALYAKMKMTPTRSRKSISNSSATPIPPRTCPSSSTSFATAASCATPSPTAP